MSAQIQLLNAPESGDFIKFVEDGIEYYTERLSGRSGMSHRGLGRFVGKSQPSISYWVQKIRSSDPISNDLPECLKSFAGIALPVVNSSDPYGSEILPDVFCSAMISYYACFAAPKDQTKEAKRSLLLSSGVGLRTLIHSKTGWMPTASPQPPLVDNQVRLKELDVRLAEIDLEKAKLMLAQAVAQPTQGMRSASSASPVKKSRTIGESGYVGEDAKRKVLNALSSGQSQSDKIVGEVKLSHTYVYRVLKVLQREGKVERRGTGAQRHQWSLTGSR